MKQGIEGEGKGGGGWESKADDGVCVRDSELEEATFTKALI